MYSSFHAGLAKCLSVSERGLAMSSLKRPYYRSIASFDRGSSEELSHKEEEEVEQEAEEMEEEEEDVNYSSRESCCMQQLLDAEMVQMSSSKQGGGMLGSSKRARRLGAEQVRALEKAFAEENKLEPERKSQLACRLGLEERQVAVWFQNRRARCKTKQLEKDFHALKRKMEALQADRDSLLKEKEHLEAEVLRLKHKTQEKHAPGVMDTPLANNLLVSSSTCMLSLPPCVRETDGASVNSMPLLETKEEVNGTRMLLTNVVDESTTSEESAIDCDESSPSRFTSTHPHHLITREQNNVILQAETVGFLDMYDVYEPRLIHIKGGDLLTKEAESDNGFVSLDWWDQAS